ncbi:MAG TPA: gephyrin-like molybdotransferase Glp, partial [Candidatus Competibacteraceae bacterium]|nr:gephyrin-like molybdotransferase Glp [Candidatus Competibacteraceae bacterium]
LDQALSAALHSLKPVATTERVRLLDAYGRILAKDVVTRLDVPPHDNSAMDGFALHLADLSVQEPVRLMIAGQVTAGHPYRGPVPHATAVRINTGGIIPEGADAVVMQEHCQLTPDEGWLELSPQVSARLQPGENIRRRGEDTQAGTLLLTKGRRLRPQDVALLAGQGISAVEVIRQLRVAVASTGDELGEPDLALPAGAIYDSNRYLLIGLLQQFGCLITDLGILRDDRETMLPAIQTAARTHDVLLTSGGVSVGNADLVKEVIATLGRIEFWRLAIKPGKPLMYGRIEDCLVLGLPGNPVAVMVTFLLFARPLLSALLGIVYEAPLRWRATADFEFRRKPGRREWLRARCRLDPTRGPLVSIYHTASSGVLSSLSWADGLVELPEDCRAVRPGDAVDYLPFSGLGVE